MVLASGSIGVRPGSIKLGHFAAMRWDHGGATLPEVFVGGEGLARGPLDVLGTLRFRGEPQSGTMTGVRTHGWPYPFRARPWQDMASFLGGMADQHSQFRHLADIVASVIDAESIHLLAGCTSMHDLLVVPVPVPDPSLDVILVRAPFVAGCPTGGMVVIEHQRCTGHNDRIQHPTLEAVALFWRFVAEKYGIHPAVPPGTAPGKMSAMATICPASLG